MFADLQIDRCQER